MNNKVYRGSIQDAINMFKDVIDGGIAESINENVKTDEFFVGDEDSGYMYHGIDEVIEEVKFRINKNIFPIVVNKAEDTSIEKSLKEGLYRDTNGIFGIYNATYTDDDLFDLFDESETSDSYIDEAQDFYKEQIMRRAFQRWKSNTISSMETLRESLNESFDFRSLGYGYCVPASNIEYYIKEISNLLKSKNSDKEVVDKFMKSSIDYINNNISDINDFDKYWKKYKKEFNKKLGELYYLLTDTDYANMVKYKNINESLNEAKEANPLKGIRSNMIEAPNGEVLYVYYNNGKLIAGGATNVGIIPEFEIDYDFDESADENISKIYDLILNDDRYMSESCKKKKSHKKLMKEDDQMENSKPKRKRAVKPLFDDLYDEIYTRLSNERINDRFWKNMGVYSAEQMGIGRAGDEKPGYELLTITITDGKNNGASFDYALDVIRQIKENATNPLQKDILVQKALRDSNKLMIYINENAPALTTVETYNKYSGQVPPKEDIQTESIKKTNKKGLKEMLVTKEVDLPYFEFWSGAKDTAKHLTFDELRQIGYILEDAYPDGMNETDLNDFFWFEEDTIAEWLGYDSFEDLCNRENNEDDLDESYPESTIDKIKQAEVENTKNDHCYNCGAKLKFGDYGAYCPECGDDYSGYDNGKFIPSKKISNVYDNTDK